MLKDGIPAKDVVHPDGKILLKNGNVLECYPKENQAEAIEGDKFGLDRTGEFLHIKGAPRNQAGRRESEPWEELFFKEAFFLYEQREKIMADSRMFLTPLPFRNNLAYIGTRYLSKATLGVYLEWWEDCKRAVIMKDGEIDALTYFIAGSPLSGSNKCAAVDRDGKSREIHFHGPFMEIWTSFMDINERYKEAKEIYQAYTMEETISKLRGL